MKAKWLRSAWTAGAGLIGLMVIGIPVFIGHGKGSPWDINTWQRMASPGDLSQAHASLEHNCAACHAPCAGVFEPQPGEWGAQRMPVQLGAPGG